MPTLSVPIRMPQITEMGKYANIEQKSPAINSKPNFFKNFFDFLFLEWVFDFFV